MAKKKEMTKKEKIYYIMTLPCILEDNIAREYFEHELEMLENKKTNSNKAKQKEAENIQLMEKVLNILSADEKGGMTATEIQKAIDEDITCQKTVSILRLLIDENKVVRFTCKKVVYFTLQKERSDEE